MSKTSRAIYRVLIIKPGAIGDLLQLTPVIRALKSRFPACAVDVVVGSPVTAQLFRHNEAVRETIVFDKRGEQRTVLSLLKMWRYLHRNNYDLVLHFQRSNLKMWLLASAAFPCRVLVYHKTGRNIHAVANFLETLVPLGISSSDFGLELTPGPADRVFANEYLASISAGNRPVIALNPGASHPVNRWGAERFAELADLVTEKLSAKVIIIGGPDDAAVAKSIASVSRSQPAVAAGKLSLLQTGALLERCAALVSGDTGPLHLATAVGTKVVALFGAADPDRTGPIGTGHWVIQAEGVDCVPCRSRRCSNRNYLECMEKISVEKVFNALTKVLLRGSV